MLSTAGWIDGITASCVIIFGIIFGFFFIYKSKKEKAKLLVYLGIVNILAGLMFLGVFLDFLMVIFFNHNLDTPYGIVALLSYIWYAPTVIFAMYIGAELLVPEKKRLIVCIFIVLSIIFEIIIFIDPVNSFNIVHPQDTANPDVLIDYNINFGTLAGMLMAALLIPVLIFLGIGFLNKSVQSTGELKKNFLLLSVGSFCFCIFGLLEALTEPGIALIFVRGGYSISFWFMYFGLQK